MVNRDITLMGLIAAMVLLPSSIGPIGAAPGDRPSPPGDVAAHHCSKQEQTPPKICVTFKNTATEPVGFWFEWTRNGEKLPSTLAGYDVGCVTGSVYGCEALNWFGGPSPYAAKIRYNTDREWAFGFTLRNLDYDTEFCFRFKAVNEDGLVSENWTRWVCANTGPVPVFPSAPAAPVVTLIQGTSGRRTVGEGTPPKLLVEWEKVPSQNVGWYDIEIESISGTYATVRSGTRHEAAEPAEFTLTLSPETRVTEHSKFKARVCPANPAMRRCSPWGGNVVLSSTLAEARDDTTRTTLPPPGTGRFEPGAPASRDGAAVGADRGTARTAVPPAEAPRTLGKRKRPTAGTGSFDPDSIDPSIYDQYVGRYSASPSHIVTISRDGDGLFAQQLDASRPDLKVELVPQSTVRFVSEPAGILVWFAKDAAGQVASIKIVYGDREVRAMRIRN